MSRVGVRWPVVLSVIATAVSWPATSAIAASPKGSGTEIVFLGTAGGPPLRIDRSEPSTLLIVDGREYLIDCGIGTARRMIEGGIDSKQIKTIFFTHLHADHDMGLADVMANDFFERGPVGADDPINIYGPPQTKELVDSAFNYISVGFRPFAAGNFLAYRQENGALVSPFLPHEIAADGLVFQDDRIRVTAAENAHYVKIPASERRRFKSYSYRIDTPHGSIVFTGDTGPSDAVARLSDGADVLVAEATYRDQAGLKETITNAETRAHWSPTRAASFREHFVSEHLDADEIGQLASNAGVKTVILYHYDPKDSTDAAKYVAEVKSRFSGPVFASHDLERYCVTSGTIAPCKR
jgi:ribonuclease BN (tRNA processing enzyme)